jgi:hypothetical protein
MIEDLDQWENEQKSKYLSQNNSSSNQNILDSNQDKT